MRVQPPTMFNCWFTAETTNYTGSWTAKPVSSAALGLRRKVRQRHIRIMLHVITNSEKKGYIGRGLVEHQAQIGEAGAMFQGPCELITVYPISPNKKLSSLGSRYIMPTSSIEYAKLFIGSVNYYYIHVVQLPAFDFH